MGGGFLVVRIFKVVARVVVKDEDGDREVVDEGGDVVDGAVEGAWVVVRDGGVVVGGGGGGSASLVIKVSTA